MDISLLAARILPYRFDHSISKQDSDKLINKYNISKGFKMSDEIKVNRVATQSSSAPSQQPKIEQAKTEHVPSLTQDLKEATTSSGANRRMPWIILGIIVVVLIIGGVAFRDKLFGSKSASSDGSVKGAATTAQKYQAVFLTNGQVYFGKITNTTSDYVTLTDIWYLQVVQPQQPIQGQQPAQQQTQPQISLVKLGNELHGPVDEMHISKPQILFYEDLKSDGQVVKTILDEKAKQAK